MSLTSSTQPRVITEEIVHNGALLMFALKDTVTSLELKSLLRGLGFWADQVDVSAHLKTLSKKHDWVIKTIKSVNSSGSFNEYSLTPVSVADDVSVPIVIAVDDPTSISSRVIDIISNNILYLDDIDLNMTLEDDLDIDDLDLVEILMDIELKFDTVIGDDVVASWQTVGDIVNTLAGVPQAPVVPAPVKRTRIKINIQPLESVAIANAIQIAGYFSKYSPNEWLLTSVSSDHVAVYHSSHTRDHVRSAFATLSSQRIQDVRARRMRNVK